MVVGSLAWVFAGIAVVVGVVVYRRDPVGYCSDCDHRLKSGEPVCPGCRRRVAGEIDHRKHRLDAEERVLAQIRASEGRQAESRRVSTS
jgi:predicted amidophosphoribosyltransferase